MIEGHVTPGAAGFVIAGEHGDPFKQGGFTGPVFANDDCDGPIETQLKLIPQKGKTKRIGRAVGDARRVQPDAPEVWRRHIDGPIAF
jgi:hypothetical protein